MFRTPKNYPIRGLRVCQNVDCRLHMNRDRSSALLVGLQLQRLFRGDPPIASMTDEGRELYYDESNKTNRHPTKIAWSDLHPLA